MGRVLTTINIEEDQNIAFLAFRSRNFLAQRKKKEFESK